MSASLLVLIPPALLAIVVLLCFVGCVLYRSGNAPSTELFGPPFTQYSDVTIDSNPVSYWPLGEAAGTVAQDTKGTNGVRNGTYLSQLFPDDPPLQSAAAPGTLK